MTVEIIIHFVYSEVRVLYIIPNQIVMEIRTYAVKIIESMRLIGWSMIVFLVMGLIYFSLETIYTFRRGYSGLFRASLKSQY